MGGRHGADDREADGREVVAIQTNGDCVSIRMDSLETESVRQQVGVDLLADMLSGGPSDAGSRKSSVFAVATAARPWGRDQAYPQSLREGLQVIGYGVPHPVLVSSDGASRWHGGRHHLTARRTAEYAASVVYG